MGRGKDSEKWFPFHLVEEMKSQKEYFFALESQRFENFHFFIQGSDHSYIIEQEFCI